MYELIIDSGKVKRMKEKMKQQIWRKKGREGRMKCFEFYRAAALEGKVEKIYHEEEEQPSQVCLCKTSCSLGSIFFLISYFSLVTTLCSLSAQV